MFATVNLKNKKKTNPLYLPPPPKIRVRNRTYTE